MLGRQPEIVKVSAEVGFEPGGTYFTGYSMGSVNSAFMMVTLVDVSARGRDIWQVIDGVRDEALRTIPGIRRLTIKEMGADVMASSAAPVQVIFHGRTSSGSTRSASRRGVWPRTSRACTRWRRPGP